MKKHCRAQNQDPHSAAFQKRSCLAIGFAPCVDMQGLLSVLLRWIGCKVLATLVIVVMKKCTDNFQMNKVFGTLYKHMILIKLFLL